MEPILDYEAILGGERENKQPKGFSWDMDTFENMCDAFTPMEDIVVALNTTEERLDEFCKICYNGCTFASIWRQLVTYSKICLKMGIKRQAMGGNPTALRLAAEAWAGMGESDKEKSVNITIKNDLV